MPSYSEILELLTSNGWEMQSEGQSGAQLKNSKKVMRLQTKIAIILGAVLVFAYGVGLLVLLFAMADYSQTPHQTFFLSRENPHLPPKPGLKISGTMKVCVGFIGLIILLVILGNLRR